MSPVAFLGPKNAPKSLAVGALPQTPLRELTALPRPPSWISGAYSKAPTSNERGGEETAGERERQNDVYPGLRNPRAATGRMSVHPSGKWSTLRSVIEISVGRMKFCVMQCNGQSAIKDLIPLVCCDNRTSKGISLSDNHAHAYLSYFTV